MIGMSMESTKKKIATAKATLSSAGKDLAIGNTKHFPASRFVVGVLPNGQPSTRRPWHDCGVNHRDDASETAGSNRCGILAGMVAVQPRHPGLFVDRRGGVVWWLGSVQISRRPADREFRRTIGLPLPSVNRVGHVRSPSPARGEETAPQAPDGKTIVPVREVRLPTESRGPIRGKKSPSANRKNTCPRETRADENRPQPITTESNGCNRLRQTKKEKSTNSSANNRSGNGQITNTLRWSLAGRISTATTRSQTARSRCRNQIRQRRGTDQARRAVLAAEQQTRRVSKPLGIVSKNAAPVWSRPNELAPMPNSKPPRNN